MILKDYSVRIGWSYCDSVHRLLHFVGPITARAGDVLDIRWQYEATNKNDFNVGLGRFVAIGCYPSTINDVSGDRVIPAVMDNVTPEMHHSVITGSDLVVLERDLVGEYVKLVVLAATSVQKNKTISYEPNYGFLTVEAR